MYCRTTDSSGSLSDALSTSVGDNAPGVACFAILQTMSSDCPLLSGWLIEFSLDSASAMLVLPGWYTTVYSNS